LPRMVSRIRNSKGFHSTICGEKDKKKIRGRLKKYSRQKHWQRNGRFWHQINKSERKRSIVASRLFIVANVFENEKGVSSKTLFTKSRQGGSDFPQWFHDVENYLCRWRKSPMLHTNLEKCFVSTWIGWHF
jgi:hypothetical protein